jgi:hypothetical protein
VNPPGLQTQTLRHSLVVGCWNGRGAALAPPFGIFESIAVAVAFDDVAPVREAIEGPFLRSRQAEVQVHPCDADNNRRLFAMYDQGESE